MHNTVSQYSSNDMPDSTFRTRYQRNLNEVTKKCAGFADKLFAIYEVKCAREKKTPILRPAYNKKFTEMMIVSYGMLPTDVHMLQDLRILVNEVALEFNTRTFLGEHMKAVCQLVGAKICSEGAVNIVNGTKEFADEMRELVSKNADTGFFDRTARFVMRPGDRSTESGNYLGKRSSLLSTRDRSVTLDQSLGHVARKSVKTTLEKRDAKKFEEETL
jgi:hypothetical protein